MSNHVSHAALPYPIKGARFTIALPFRLAGGVLTDPSAADTEFSLDAGAFSDCAEEVTTLSGSNGMGYITLTGAETNGSLLAVASKSSNDLETPVVLFPRVLASVSTGTLSAGSAGGGTLAPVLAYDVTGCFIMTTGGTGGGGTGGANNQARKIVTYTVSTGAFTVTPNWETTPSTDTTYTVLLPEGHTLGTLKALNPTTAGNTLDVTATGGAGIDWSNVEAPTTTLNLSGTTIKTATDVATAIATAQTEITETGADVDELITSLATAQTGITEIAVDTDTIITNVATAQTEITETGADVDEIISTLATMTTNLQEANDDLDELITTAGTLATTTALATAQTAITEIAVDTDSLITSLSTAQTGITEIATDTDTILTNLATAQTEITETGADVDELIATAATLATAAGIAAEVQTGLTAQGYTSGRADLLDHLDADVSSAGGGSDPLLNDVPGSYAAGTAGYILGTNLDAAVSSVSGVVYGEAGSVTYTFTVYDTDDTTPLAGAAVYVSSDSAGVHRSQTKLTDSVGHVQFALDPGTVYLWPSRVDRVFVVPITETVS